MLDKIKVNIQQLSKECKQLEKFLQEGDYFSFEKLRKFLNFENLRVCDFFSFEDKVFNFYELKHRKIILKRDFFEEYLYLRSKFFESFILLQNLFKDLDFKNYKFNFFVFVCKTGYYLKESDVSEDFIEEKVVELKNYLIEKFSGLNKLLKFNCRTYLDYGLHK